ncbi:hypothetical protein ACHWQZ_G002499 [Mnemiopsis leidyi]
MNRAGESQDFTDTEGIPYIVLIGDVGTGKSTIIEKLTNEIGRSSDSDISFTRTSEQFWTYDESMIISDTPGSNAVEDKLGHNISIAHALNWRPVWRIMIIVKAETRMDNVLAGIRKYAEQLLEFPMDLMGALVTHMDMVSWSEEKFKGLLDSELGIDTVVFSRLDTPRENLLEDLRQLCVDGVKITIDDENFLKVFKINDNRLKILRSTNREVENFKKIKAGFDEARKLFNNSKDQVDLIFEYQAHMRQEIEAAQRRVAEENDFTFSGDEAANEAGHIANMVNQMRVILYDVRVEAARYHSAHGVEQARRCPHCNLIWTKVEGCDGATTCGNRPTGILDVRDPSYGVLGTFTFKQLSDGVCSIFKTGTRTVSNRARDDGASNFYGCGKSITWSEMPVVELPEEMRKAVPVTMDDNVRILSDSIPGAERFLYNLRKLLGGCAGVMSKKKPGKN